MRKAGPGRAAARRHEPGGLLWQVSLGAGALLLDRALTRLLGPFERTEVRAFAGERDRALARLSRAVSRLQASALVGGAVAPRAWRFRRLRSGARQLVAPAGRHSGAKAGLRVNLAIADNENLLLAAAWIAPSSVPGAGASRAWGVDVEAWRCEVDAPGIAARFFSAGEVALLAREPHTDTRLFTLLWTAKEALAKAKGLPLPAVLGMPLLGEHAGAGAEAEDGVGTLGREGRLCERLLREGLAYGRWVIRWTDLGADVAAVCTRRWA